MDLVKNIRINLSCYRCGSIDFEAKEMHWKEIEGMFFVDYEDNPVFKCSKCGLEDNLQNLMPRGFLHKELID